MIVSFIFIFFSSDKEFSSKSRNQDFNLSTSESTTVLNLAKTIWKKIEPKKPFKYVSDIPYEHDVQKRIPDVTKAKTILNYNAKTSLSEMLDEVIPWISSQIKENKI